MRKMCAVFMVALIVTGCGGVNIHGTQYEARAVGLQKMIAELQSALALVSDEVEKKTSLVLSDAVLTVNTEIGKSKEGGADLWIVSGKASREDKSSDKVTIKLVPIKKQKQMGTVEEKTLSEKLAMNIISAVEGVSNAGAGKYPLSVDQLTIEMGITTVTAGSAGAGIELEVLPISVSGKGTYSKSNIDTLKIEFVQKKQAR